MNDNVISVERIERAIYLIRGQKVMLDRDLAALYEVETKRLKEQVRRNIDRFPEDFMFVLTTEEFAIGGRNLRPPIPTVWVSVMPPWLLPNRAWRCCRPC